MRISICGAGWIGLPLAKIFTQSGHQVVATKRSEADANSLARFGINGLAMDLYSPLDTHSKSLLFDCDVLVINIPPGRKSFQPEVFYTAMCTLIDDAKGYGVKNLLFVSTSSVYGDVEGRVTESSPLSPSTASGKVHQDIERYVQEVFGEDASVLRLAGLIGDDRHPVKHLAGRKDIANGQQSVNLVHQTDVLEAIQCIVEKRIFGKRLHLCATEHPSRQEYYTWAAQQLSLPEPEFASPGSGKGKQLDCSETLNILGLELRYPSPCDMLDSAGAAD